jgi:hypothetical protein
VYKISKIIIIKIRIKIIIINSIKIIVINRIKIIVINRIKIIFKIINKNLINRCIYIIKKDYK